MAPVTGCSIRVSSVSEYLTAINEAFKTLCNPNVGSRCELWFRGQIRSDFNLTPSIGRSPRNPTLEPAYLSKFKSLVIPYIQTEPAFPLPDGISSYWSWLFLMQHYGVPTRLLDWSRDALTALFFATDPSDTSRNSNQDSAVWVLNPVTLNTAFTFNPNLKPGYIPNVEEPEFNALFGPDSPPSPSGKPAAAIGPLNSTRIVAQRGVFTVFPLQKEVVPMNSQPDSSNYLLEICVAAENFDSIHVELEHYGITRIALFPEIQQIANEITLEINNEGVLDP